MVINDFVAALSNKCLLIRSKGNYKSVAAGFSLRFYTFFGAKFTQAKACGYMDRDLFNKAFCIFLIIFLLKYKSIVKANSINFFFIELFWILFLSYCSQNYELLFIFGILGYHQVGIQDVRKLRRALLSELL